MIKQIAALGGANEDFAPASVTAAVYRKLRPPA
jgi:hypothetical protein